jgi:gluconolactonase
MYHSFGMKTGAAAIVTAGLLAGMCAVAQAPPAKTALPALVPDIAPTFTVDLMTPAGMSMFGAQWRYMDAKIVETPALPKAGPQWKTTYDIAPKAGETNFDDSTWPVIDPQTLKLPRGGGKISFAWYRTWLTIPSKIGDFDPTGAKVALVVTVDDYAEVSVNGQMPRSVGHTSPATIQGFNMPNRVLLSDSVKPGDKFEIAILGINGPISLAPSNFIFFRQASVEFFKAPQ